MEYIHIKLYNTEKTLKSGHLFPYVALPNPVCIFRICEYFVFVKFGAASIVQIVSTCI